MALKLKAVEAAPPHEAAQNAIRDGLSDLLVRLDPASAGMIAVSLIRMAAAFVALAEAQAVGGPRSAALELMLLLSDGPPQLPVAPAADHAAAA